MKLSILFPALTALTCVGATDRHETSGAQLRDLHSVFEGEGEGERSRCTLYTGHSLPTPQGGEGTEKIVCGTDDNRVYTVTQIPTDFFDETPLASGSTRISVLKSCLYDTDYIDMTACAAEMLDSNVANRSANTKASRSLIVMRVIDSEGLGPTSSKAVFADKIFGINGDVFNLSSGYASCSGNNLEFVPGVYSQATDGVMDLTLTSSAAGLSASETESLAFTAMGNLPDFIPNSYDHIMFILDPSKNLLAYAYINWQYSVFQDEWAKRPSALIHELGHNLGYLHSGEGDDQYGDQSGMMGYSYSADEGPVMCFNAAKSWYTGWYSNADIDAPSSNGEELNLIGIDDYVNGVHTEAHTTVVRIWGGSEDLYLMYNKEKGINSDTKEFPDTVNIVSQSGRTAQSWTRAQLSAGQTYTSSNYGGTGQSLVITVCEMTDGTPGITPDVARTLVYVENADQPSCTQLTPSPTPTPITPTPAPITPTPAPITPTSAPITPTSAPDCVDDPTLRFLWKIKKGTPKVYKGKSCRWLLKQKDRPKTLKRVCKKNACKNNLLEPRRVCPEACEFCDPCDQNIKSKFFKETIGGKDKKKSCKWLQKQKPKKQIKYCSITVSPFCYGTAKEICPKVCKAVTGCNGD